MFYTWFQSIFTWNWCLILGNCSHRAKPLWFVPLQNAEGASPDWMFQLAKKKKKSLNRTDVPEPCIFFNMQFFCGLFVHLCWWWSILIMSISLQSRHCVTATLLSVSENCVWPGFFAYEYILLIVVLYLLLIVRLKAFIFNCYLFIGKTILLSVCKAF